MGNAAATAAATCAERSEMQCDGFTFVRGILKELMMAIWKYTRSGVYKYIVIETKKF